MSKKPGGKQQTWWPLSPVAEPVWTAQSSPVSLAGLGKVGQTSAAKRMEAQSRKICEIEQTLLVSEAGGSDGLGTAYRRGVSQSKVVLDRLDNVRQRDLSAWTALDHFTSEVRQARVVALAELKARYAELQRQLNDEFEATLSRIEQRERQILDGQGDTFQVLQQRLDAQARVSELIKLKLESESKTRFLQNLRYVLDEANKLIEHPAPQAVPRDDVSFIDLVPSLRVVADASESRGDEGVGAVQQQQGDEEGEEVQGNVQDGMDATQGKPLARSDTLTSSYQRLENAFLGAMEQRAKRRLERKDVAPLLAQSASVRTAAEAALSAAASSDDDDASAQDGEAMALSEIVSRVGRLEESLHALLVQQQHGDNSEFVDVSAHAAASTGQGNMSVSSIGSMPTVVAALGRRRTSVLSRAASDTPSSAVPPQQHQHQLQQQQKQQQQQHQQHQQAETGKQTDGRASLSSLPSGVSYASQWTASQGSSATQDVAHAAWPTWQVTPLGEEDSDEDGEGDGRSDDGHASQHAVDRVSERQGPTQQQQQQQQDEADAAVRIRIRPATPHLQARGVAAAIAKQRRRSSSASSISSAATATSQRGAARDSPTAARARDAVSTGSRSDVDDAADNDQTAKDNAAMLRLQQRHLLEQQELVRSQLEEQRRAMAQLAAQTSSTMASALSQLSDLNSSVAQLQSMSSRDLSHAVSLAPGELQALFDQQQRKQIEAMASLGPGELQALFAAGRNADAAPLAKQETMTGSEMAALFAQRQASRAAMTPTSQQQQQQQQQASPVASVAGSEMNALFAQRQESTNSIATQQQQHRRQQQASPVASVAGSEMNALFAQRQESQATMSPSPQRQQQVSPAPSVAGSEMHALFAQRQPSQDSIAPQREQREPTSPQTLVAGSEMAALFHGGASQASLATMTGEEMQRLFGKTESAASLTAMQQPQQQQQQRQQQQQPQQQQQQQQQQPPQQQRVLQRQASSASLAGTELPRLFSSAAPGSGLRRAASQATIRRQVLTRQASHASMLAGGAAPTSPLAPPMPPRPQQQQALQHEPPLASQPLRQQQQQHALHHEPSLASLPPRPPSPPPMPAQDPLAPDATVPLPASAARLVTLAGTGDGASTERRRSSVSQADLQDALSRMAERRNSGAGASSVPHLRVRAASPSRSVGTASMPDLLAASGRKASAAHVPVGPSPMRFGSPLAHERPAPRIYTSQSPMKRTQSFSAVSQQQQQQPSLRPATSFRSLSAWSTADRRDDDMRSARSFASAGSGYSARSTVADMASSRTAATDAANVTDIVANLREKLERRRRSINLAHSNSMKTLLRTTSREVFDTLDRATSSNDMRSTSSAGWSTGGRRVMSSRYD